MEQLSRTERLILINQYEILSKLQPDDDLYNAAIEILTWGYEYEYHTLFGRLHDGVPIEICKETIDILNMFRRFNNILHGLTKEEIDKLGERVEKLQFRGFDANNDLHYHYTVFMVEKLGKWKEIQQIYLNSHDAYTITEYRQMLEEYKSSGFEQNYKATFEELLSFIERI